MSSRNLLTLYERHGFISNHYPREKGQDIAAYLVKDQRTIYAGFDPTASSLHIGNLLVICGLLHAQKAGHKSIALIGGATAQIGDPSGKKEERPTLDLSDIKNNLQGLQNNLLSIFENFSEMYGIKDNPPIIVNNSDWYSDLNLIDFLYKFGKHYRLSDMINKDLVKRRLEVAAENAGDPNAGISLQGFMYQAVQAYDWLHLSQNHDCFIQLGGNDQFGNIAAGHDLIKRMAKKEAYGLMVPLVTTESGQKLGKSEGNSVWLSPKLTSPYEFYQYFVRQPDSNVEKLLNYFTFLPPMEIQNLLKKHQHTPEKREAQYKLAELITQLVHGAKGLELAEQSSKLLFGSPETMIKTLQTLSREEIQDIFPGAKLSRQFFQSGLTILDFSMKLGVFPNEKYAQHNIEAGAFSVNQIKRKNIDEILLHGDHILANNLSLVRIGKKKFIIVDWM